MSDSPTCPSCGADLLGTEKFCASCDADLAPQARAAFARAEDASARAMFWRRATGFAAVVALVIGVIMGGMASGLANGQDRCLTGAQMVDIPDEPLPIEYVHDTFMRSLNDKLGIEFLSWVPTSHGGILLEMAPQTSSGAPPLWSRLNDDDRYSLMAVISVAYTQAILASGRSLDLESGGHPEVALRYRGATAPVALRDRSGKITIFPSPSR